MSGPALTVVLGDGSNALVRTAAVPRIRPGDRPVGVETALNAAEVRTLRARAHAAGLGADALIAIILEYESLCRLAGRGVVAQLGDECAVEAAGFIERIVAPELRGWQRLLIRRVVPPNDDLPTAFVPLRLAAAIPVSARAAAVLEAGEASERDVRRAVALELAATADGVVMQTFALRALAGFRSGRAAPAL